MQKTAFGWSFFCTFDHNYLIAMKQFLFLTAMVALLFASCTFTSTSTKTPEIDQPEALTASIDSLVPNSGLDLNGSSRNVNGMVTNEAELIVYNAEGLKKGTAGKQQIAFAIAQTLYQNIANRKEFNQFLVTFVFQDGNFSETQRFAFSHQQLK